jgi:hypothetical protein
MANEFIKATRVVRTALGLLVRDVVTPRLVWRDAAGDFRGAKDETITIKVPAYFESNKRSLRAGTSKTKSALAERSVDVTLTDNLYGVIPITDEELTLDIDSFEEQIVVPVLGGIVRGLEDEIVTEIQTGPTYQHSLELDLDNPTYTLTRARRLLNDSRVPKEGRAVIVGSAIEEALINALTPADETGSDSALREAAIGRLRGFGVFQVDALDPYEGYAFHRTAYVLNSRAPFVSRGTPWGATESFEGFAIRVAQAVDPDELTDNFHADVYVGTNHVTDAGNVDDDGIFTPAEDPDESGVEDLFVRGVKITMAESS